MGNTLASHIKPALRNASPVYSDEYPGLYVGQEGGTLPGDAWAIPLPEGDKDKRSTERRNLDKRGGVCEA